MTYPDHRLRVLLAILGSIALVGHAAERTFTGASQVVSVEVPVSVVDRDGRPVRDLTIADFEIRDDGRVQPITALSLVDLSSPEATEVSATAEPPPVARRYFLFLFDLSFSTPANTSRARRAALSFVQHGLHPSDLAAVATFSLETGPRMLVTFSPDRAQLARAIETLGVPGLLTRGRVADPLRFLIERPGVAGDGIAGNTGPPTGGGSRFEADILEALRAIQVGASRADKSFQRQRVNAWSRSLGEMGRLLASVEGRKQVLYFSEGFDGRLLFGRQPSPDDVEAQQARRDLDAGQLWLVDTDDTFGNASLRGQVDAMLEELRRADCVIQAVDISGLGGETGVERATRDVGQDALFYVADQTGGELFEDANDLEAQLGRALTRSSVTYLLSFEPSEVSFDGAYHRLSVEVKRRGLRVSHRQGYYAPRPFEELHPLERDLLAATAIATGAPRSEVDLQLLAAPFPATQSLAYVPVVLEIGGRSLLAGSETGEVGVELYGYVTDSQGVVRDFFTQKLDLDLSLSGEAIRRRGIKYYGQVLLPAGSYLVRVLVRNARTGAAGVISRALEVPDFAAGRPVVLPPFFVEPVTDWVMVRQPVHGDGESLVYPFTLAGEPFVPTSELRRGVDGGWHLCLVAYHLGGRPTVVVRAIGLSAGAAPVEVPGAVEETVTGQPEQTKLELTLDSSVVPPGDYRVELEVSSEGSRNVVWSLLRVRG